MDKNYRPPSSRTYARSCSAKMEFWWYLPRKLLFLFSFCIRYRLDTNAEKLCWCCVGVIVSKVVQNDLFSLTTFYYVFLQIHSYARFSITGGKNPPAYMGYVIILTSLHCLKNIINYTAKIESFISYFFRTILGAKNIN